MQKIVKKQIKIKKDLQKERKNYKTIKLIKIIKLQNSAS